ncbi:MAG TPA: hypothetical protein DCP90_00905 [Clostridiales bacterium]|nr:MAG: hypothetical protein A2Y22_07840 [Clostridiales bacterium GWD2_32_59]HAN09155.1 hypothetical protein [Clostridiales bacterium]
MSEIKFEITKEIAVLSERAGGWTKEINMVSWNERPPKYDIREWTADHQKMGKGITLSSDEMTELKKALESLEE